MRISLFNAIFQQPWLIEPQTQERGEAMNEQILPRAILMDLKTGQQFDVNLQSDIQPFPTEPAEEAPAAPLVFHKTVTFKATKKDKLAFKRLMRKSNKVPRKLKKALRHVGFSNQ